MFGKKNQEADLEFFVVFDSKVGNYRVPFCAINGLDVIRDFTNLFSDDSQRRNQYVTNSEDFSIFKIGEYSKKTGVFTPCTHEHVCNLHDLRSSAMRSSNFQNGAPLQPIQQ